MLLILYWYAVGTAVLYTRHVRYQVAVITGTQFRGYFTPANGGALCNNAYIRTRMETPRVPVYNFNAANSQD